MNKSSATIMAAALMLASSCTEVKQEGQGYEPIIGKQEITIKDGRLTPEALWAMGRIGSLSISPDGKQIAYTVAYYSVPENKSHHVIYVMDADGKNNTLLTQTAWNESEPQWIKGGTKIAFLCNESGGSQIWEMNPDGTERRIISDFKGNIEGFSFSPDGKKILFISQIKYGQRTVDLYPDLLQASCSIPPKGFIGASNGSPSMISVAAPIMLPSKSAIKGCGILSTHSSQCLYIRSFTMIPLALGRSG